MMSAGFLALICLAFLANMFLFLRMDFGHLPKPLRSIGLLPITFLLTLVGFGSAFRDQLFEIPALIVMAAFIIYMTWSIWSVIELFRSEKEKS